MCFPLVFAAVGAVASVASGAMSMMAACGQAKAMEAQGRYAKDMANRNAEITEENARIQRDQAEIEYMRADAQAEGYVSSAENEIDQAIVATNNAALARRSAEVEMERAREAEDQHRLEVAQIYGQQVIGMAANGIDIGYGSAAKVLADTEYLADADAARILETGRRNAYGFTIEADNWTKANQIHHRNADAYYDAADTAWETGRMVHANTIDISNNTFQTAVNQRQAGEYQYAGAMAQASATRMSGVANLVGSIAGAASNFGSALTSFGGGGGGSGSMAYSRTTNTGKWW